MVPRLQRGARAAVRFLARSLGRPLRSLRRWEQRFAHGRAERFLWRHRQELVLVVSLILFAGSFVHLQRYPELNAQASDQAPAPGPTTTGSPSDDPPALAGGAVVVGPGRGEQLAPYIADRRDALAGIADDEIRVAVVSFTEHLTGEQAAEVVPDGVTALEVELRLPDPQMEPFEVAVGEEREDGEVGEEGEEREEREEREAGAAGEDGIESAVNEALAAERERIAREEAEFRELLESGTVEDEDFVAEFRQQLERLKAVRNLLDTGAGTVFAVVVRGPVAELRALAEAERVRLVDPAPAETDPAASTFYGLLPDDDETASYGGV